MFPLSYIRVLGFVIVYYFIDTGPYHLGIFEMVIEIFPVVFCFRNPSESSYRFLIVLVFNVLKFITFS